MLSFDIRDLESARRYRRREVLADDPSGRRETRCHRAPIRVAGRLSAAGAGRFYWHGRIAGTAVLPCRRCLTETSVAVEDEAHLIFAEAGDAKTDDEVDDPDVYRFDPRAKELDLRPAVRELWLLNAPAFVLCREDCKGLCPTCGADLNAGPCSCPPTHDARWDALHKLDSSSTRKFRSLDSLTIRSTHGRPEAQNLQAKEARPQHAQEGGAHRPPEVSPLPGDEAPASRV